MYNLESGKVIELFLQVILCYVSDASKFSFGADIKCDFPLKILYMVVSKYLTETRL